MKGLKLKESTLHIVCLYSQGFFPLAYIKLVKIFLMIIIKDDRGFKKQNSN